MSHTTTFDDSSAQAPKDLLDQARAGTTQALGTLLDLYRNYLHLIATSQLSPQLRTRVSPSDVVQETFLRAHETFAQFRGSTRNEFVAWLRKVLASRIVELLEKHVEAEKRDVRRERSPRGMNRTADQSSIRLETLLIDLSPSPSSHARHDEDARLLADEIAKLPQDYRRVLTLRNVDGLSFAEIAEQMERSSAAVRMLWLRAVEMLKSQLQAKGVV